MSNRIEVIGGHGFIGRHIVKRLGAGGFHATVSERLTGAASEADGLRRKLDEVSWLVHAASFSTPASTQKAPGSEIEGNLLPLARLIEAMLDRPGSRLLYLSSAGATYAESAIGNPDERHGQAPRSFHGAAKVAAESFLRALAAQVECQVVVVRPSNVYGPGQRAKAGFGLVPTLLRSARQGTPVNLFGDGSAVRDYIFVDDLGDLVETVVREPFAPGVETFNASSGLGHSVLEVVREVESVTGRRLDIRFTSGRAVDASRVVPSPELARQRFSWVAGTSLRNGIERTWQWLLQQEND